MKLWRASLNPSENALFSVKIPKEKDTPKAFTSKFRKIEMFMSRSSKIKLILTIEASSYEA